MNELLHSLENTRNWESLNIVENTQVDLYLFLRNFLISSEREEGSTSQASSRDFQGLTVERLRALLKAKGLSLKGKKVIIYLFKNKRSFFNGKEGNYKTVGSGILTFSLLCIWHATFFLSFFWNWWFIESDPIQIWSIYFFKYWWLTAPLLFVPCAGWADRTPQRCQWMRMNSDGGGKKSAAHVHLFRRGI